MKIIAKTETGYLMDMTEGEIAAAMGIPSSYSREWKEKTAGLRGNRDGNDLKVGSRFNPEGVHSRLAALTRAEQQIREGAEAMASLSKLTLGALNGLMTAPPEETPAIRENPEDRQPPEGN